MAKVVITYDTSSKDLSVEMDGKAIDNVQDVHVSRGGGYYSDKKENEFSFGLVTMDKKESEGYKTYTQIMAKDSSEGKALVAEGAGTFPLCSEFVSKKGICPKLQRDISNFLRKK